MPVKDKLPPGCGLDLQKPFLYNPYQVELLKARRQRICAVCAWIGPCDGYGIFRCRSCGTVEPSQLIARKAFHRLGIVGGRRSGKTKVGAMAAREEVVVPDGLGWVMGPTFKDLHDSTMPTFFRLLPPHWIANWSAGDQDLTLINNHVIQFRSLDDPERGRGQGPTWGWMDEVQKMKMRAWDVFRPSLTENRGNCIFTWTPNGFDWTWQRLFRPAFDTTGKYRQPGFWMAKCRTIDNPWIQKYALDEIEEARRTMPPAMFRQEYEADFVSFVGNVYDWDAIEPQILRGDEIRSFIPTWPIIPKAHQGLIGMGGGISHPFAGVYVIPTERGLVVVDDYLAEHRAVVKHHEEMTAEFLKAHVEKNSSLTLRWSADEDKKYIFQEFSRRGVGVVPTDHYLMAGIQRTQSWLHSKQLFFVGDTCEKILNQLRGYRWNDATADDPDEHTEIERDYRREDELPKALHSALLGWPELPTVPAVLSARELALDDKTKAEIDRVRRFESGDEDEPEPEAAHTSSVDLVLGEDFYVH